MPKRKLTIYVDDGDVRRLSVYEKNQIQALGVISIKLWRVKKKGKLMPGLEKGYLNDVGVIPEKACKGQALTHRAT